MADPLLTVTDLRVRYGRAEPAVSGASVSVAPGEFVAVVGESGSGKTTLIQAALGVLPPAATIEVGLVELDGHNIAGWSDRRLSTLRGPFVGFVPQDPGTSLNPVKKIGAQIVEALLLHQRRLPRRLARTAALEKLETAGLLDPTRVADSYPHELSGGMKQRVLIAIALANDPRLLIADEPTSALDVTVQKVILDHLERLRDELSLGILLVTHDLGVAAERADRIVVMRHGRIVEQGDAASIVESPAHEYTRALLEAAPSSHATRLTTSTARRPAVAAADVEGPARGVLFSATGIGKTFTRGTGRHRTRFTALDDVSLEVRSGTTHAIVGESGAGKSTLARVATGISRADSGSVHFDGVDIGAADRRALRALRRDVQFVYQNPFSSLDPRFTVAQLIAEPLEAYRVLPDRTARRERVAELAESVALAPELLGRRASELSGGQRQRVAIARALALSPRFIVFDEAVSALDVSVQAQILRLLVDLQAEHDLTYLFVTHDLGVVRLIADDVTVMRRGQVVERGSVDDVFAAPATDYTRALIDAIPGRAALADAIASERTA